MGEYASLLRDHLAFLARQDSPAARRRKRMIPLMLAILASLLALAAGPGWVRALLLGGAAFALACLPAMTGAWVSLIAPPIFYAKKWRMPVCRFHIDAEGIERSSRRGVWRRRWDEVRMLRRYRRGYLVFFATGAIPIPFRCMTSTQQERFRAWASRAQAIG